MLYDMLITVLVGVFLFVWASAVRVDSFNDD